MWEVAKHAFHEVVLLSMLACVVFRASGRQVASKLQNLKPFKK
jgi:hypothetical protein